MISQLLFLIEKILSLEFCSLKLLSIIAYLLKKKLILMFHLFKFFISGFFELC